MKENVQDIKVICLYNAHISIHFYGIFWYLLIVIHIVPVCTIDKLKLVIQ